MYYRLLGSLAALQRGPAPPQAESERVTKIGLLVASALQAVTGVGSSAPVSSYKLLLLLLL
jgi:hypothetical protein